MRTVTVPVTKAFEYDGKAFQVGETLTVPPIVAAALSRRGVVSLDRLALYHAAEVAPEPDPVPPPAPEPKPAPKARRRRRTYKRRDLHAEA